MESSTFFVQAAMKPNADEGIVEQAEPTRTAAGGVRRVAAEHVVRQRQAVVTFGLGELGVFAHDRAIAADVAERQGYSEMHGRFPLFGWSLLSR